MMAGKSDTSNGLSNQQTLAVLSVIVVEHGLAVNGSPSTVLPWPRPSFYRFTETSGCLGCLDRLDRPVLSLIAP